MLWTIKGVICKEKKTGLLDRFQQLDTRISKENENPVMFQTDLDKVYNRK